MTNNLTTLVVTFFVVIVTLELKRDGFKVLPVAATVGAGLVFPVIQLLGTLA